MAVWPEQSVTQNLLAGARRGDRVAVNRLLERHRAALRKLIQMRLDRQIARRVDASDVVQDVLLEANTRLQDYLADPRLPFHLWLRQLAQDRMIDMYRRHRGAQRRSLDRDQLNEEEREIILMRHFEQLSNSEAADALGLTEAAAGMRHLRALRKLRGILGDRPSQSGNDSE